MSSPDTHAPAAAHLTLARPLPDAGSSSAIEPVPADRRIADRPTRRSPRGWRRLPGWSGPAPRRWDDGRTPIHPLSLESAYADPALLRDLGARGARFARDLGVDVVVGAETAGVPLAAAVSLAGRRCRSPSSASPGTAATRSTSRRSEAPTSRAGACCSSTTPSPAARAVERFTAALAGAGAEVVGVFVLVDMRDVADTVTSVAAALPTESVSTYLQVLDLAAANGVLDPAVHDLSVDAILNHWTEDDPRWDLLPVAA